MSRPSQHFYEDDSSSALGLSHSATEAEPSRNYLLGDTEWLERNNERLERELLERGEGLPPMVQEDGLVRGLVDRDVEEQLRIELERIKADPATKKMAEPDQLALAIKLVGGRQSARHRNEGAYDEHRSEERRVAEEQPDLPLIEQVKLAHQRVAQRLAEHPTERMDGTQPGPKDATRDCLGAPTAELMRAPSSGHGGGSKSSRRREKKRGTWICDVCKLEYCEHRPVGGRPSFGGRSSHLNAYVSEESDQKLRHSDVSAGEIVEAVVKAATNPAAIRGILEGLERGA